jgi:carbonic anhydrase/acetyltransferase-like protein (isoleucine patch superfamily)
MKNIRGFKNKFPRIHKSAYIDGSAQVIGDVVIEEDCSVYPGAVLRADVEAITIEREVQIMDLAFVEAPRGHPVVIEEKSLVSHGAMVHGALIGENSLIGIGAILMENVKIGDNCIVAAGALVVAGTEIPNKSLVMGTPAKVKRKLRAKDIGNIKRGHKEAKKKARVYKRMQDDGSDRSYIH